MNRREFTKTSLTLCLAAGAGLSPLACSRRSRAPKSKFVLLGFDGMDPDLLLKLVQRGHAPNLAKLVARNKAITLGTSTPPQSPVAWANVISGADPGVHGIFDFIHRHPETYTPYLSTSETYDGEHKISLGKYAVPLKSGGVRLLRAGPVFWNDLEAAGIPASVFRIPSNFPPSESRARTMSGMGTPDLLGGYGSFTYFTTEYGMDISRITGGEVKFVTPKGNCVTSRLPGPVNSFDKKQTRGSVPFTVCFDPANPVARIEIQGRSVILNTGEWSDWIPVGFETLPHMLSASGMVRIFLKELRPHFRLYVSPVNIDPRKPAMPICTPGNYAPDLAAALGPFTTLGMPEDTKALDHGILSDEEYLHIAEQYHAEITRVLFHNLDRFDGGFLFHYFGDTDLGSHMFWSALDPEHPMHARRDPASRDTIYHYYRNLDRIAGRVLKYLGPDDTLMIISDHGFAPFYRAFNLNTWLKSNGFLGTAMDDPEAEYFDSVDWNVTRAYAAGFNGLYINESGREGNGIVAPGPDKEALVRQIQKALVSFIDPNTGARPVSHAYRADQVYAQQQRVHAPDLIVGYNAGYRASDATALGSIPLEISEINERKWSGDHCVDPVHVPGIVLSNQQIKAQSPDLRDIPATVLARFGVPRPRGMQGRTIL